MVHLVLRVLQVLEVIEDIQVLKVLKVLRELRELKELKELKEHRAQLEAHHIQQMLLKIKGVHQLIKYGLVLRHNIIVLLKIQQQFIL